MGWGLEGKAKVEVKAVPAKGSEGRDEQRIVHIQAWFGTRKVHLSNDGRRQMIPDSTRENYSEAS